MVSCRTRRKSPPSFVVGACGAGPSYASAPPLSAGRVTGAWTCRRRRGRDRLLTITEPEGPLYLAPEIEGALRLVEAGHLSALGLFDGSRAAGQGNQDGIRDECAGDLTRGAGAPIPLAGGYANQETVV